MSPGAEYMEYLNSFFVVQLTIRFGLQATQASKGLIARKASLSSPINSLLTVPRRWF